jgi:hypothetical protein
MRGDVFFTTLGEAKNWQRGNRRLFTLEKRQPKQKTKPQVFATCKNYKGGVNNKRGSAYVTFDMVAKYPDES